jgi:hypothetical protein
MIAFDVTHQKTFNVITGHSGEHDADVWLGVSDQATPARSA